jgi:hypothetical protein
MDESMSAFRPRTTKTGNLPHLSYVMRKPEPLGTEMKNGTCSKTNIMMFLHLCRGKLDNSEENEFSDITSKKIAQVSLKIMKATMPDRNFINSQQSRTNLDASPHIVLGDAWFSSVDLAYHAKKNLGLEYIGIIKTNSSHFPKAFLEQTMNTWPGGSHLVLKTTIDDVVLYAIGYKYCSTKTLTFIITEKAGHTEPGEPYIAKWTDENCNHCHTCINRPSVISTYFEHSNVVDVTNQQRQKELQLEKCWVTQDGIFCIISSLIGMTATDAWWAYSHHIKDNHRHKGMKLFDFCDYLAYDMLHNNLPDQPSLHDSHSIMDPQTLNASSTAHDRLLSPMSSIGTSGSYYGNNFQDSQISSLSDSYTADNVAASFHMAAEIAKHDVKQTHMKEHNSYKSKSGWRPKRAICIEKGCRNKTSKYCEICDPGRRDHYWLCSEHAEQHKKKILDDFKKQYNLPHETP